MSKYAIQLISKYTGDAIWLGIKHLTREAAKDYADKEVCARCHQVEFQPIPDDWQWANRHEGFKPRRES
jgi:hypothetical protein